MTFPMTHFFLHPEQAWHELRDNEEQHPAAYLPFWLLMPLIPAPPRLAGDCRAMRRLSI